MKSFVTLILLLICLSCYSPQRNCEQFHKGTFEFKTIVGYQLLESNFVRDENFEIETFEGKIDSASIRWVNPCECILTKLNPISNQDKRPLSIKILTTNKNEYTFEYAIVGDKSNKQRGTVVKIKD
tara:strand:- start:2338 stop:2715 length:378 start_codon:yes stop_codon:yes gene_type:complete